MGSVPDWKSDERQQGSDSDGDSAATPSTSKRKKKRRRKKLLNATEEQQENGKLQETPIKEKIPSKKRKKGSNLGEQFTGLSHYHNLVLVCKGIFKSFVDLYFFL